MKKKRKLTKKNFELLLSFLGDRNPGTLELVRNQIEQAVKSQPSFKKLIPNLKDPHLRSAAQYTLDEIHFKGIEEKFIDLIHRGGSLDLEAGLHLLSTVEYPDLKLYQVSNPLDQMAIDIDKLYSLQKPMPTRAISSMRKYLFEEQDFHGDESNYYDINNVFINKVIEKRKGIPITLSCIYLLVAWRLKMLVHGIGLPGHFIVGHRIPKGVVYIDPFRQGKILRIKDCEMLVRRLGVPFKQSYLDPNDKIQILSRLIVNLINFYTDEGNTQKAQWMAHLFQKLQ